jgi:hypothetical protein
MLEPRRSQYLRAMGVDLYASRCGLPAAAPSIVLPWDEALDATDDTSLLVDTQRCDHPAPVADAARTDFIPDLAVEMPRRSPLEIGVASAPRHASVTEIRLLVAMTDNGSLVIDDLPATSERAHCLRLLANLLFALERRSSPLSSEDFQWPLPGLRNRQLARDEQAVRETLLAFIAKKIQRDVMTIYLLGDSAARWLDESQRQQLGSNQPLRWKLSVATQHVLRDPRLKQRWWRDLRGEHPRG